MNHSQIEVGGAHLGTTPLRRYHPVDEWEVVGRSLASPASDGTVIYYQDTLSPLDGEGQFIDGSARAICQYLTALAVRQGVEIADGPYLQVLEDDGMVPGGWVMLRALIWVDEYDSIVPMESSATDDAGLTAAGAGGGVG